LSIVPSSVRISDRSCGASEAVRMNEEDAKTCRNWKKTIVTWDDFVMSDDVCIAVSESLGLSVGIVTVDHR